MHLRLLRGKWHGTYGMASNTWKPCAWCIWIHSTDSAPVITTSPPSPIKMSPTSCDYKTHQTSSWTHRFVAVILLTTFQKANSLWTHIQPFSKRSHWRSQAVMKLHEVTMEHFTELKGVNSSNSMIITYITNNYNKTGERETLTTWTVALKNELWLL